jgi:hypothetical protein
MTTLAHGALGGWDELVLVLCPLIFLAVLVIAGRRKGTTPAGSDAPHQSDAPTTADAPDKPSD